MRIKFDRYGLSNPQILRKTSQVHYIHAFMTIQRFRPPAGHAPGELKQLRKCLCNASAGPWRESDDEGEGSGASEGQNRLAGP